jgi:hypothetical protein
MKVVQVNEVTLKDKHEVKTMTKYGHSDRITLGIGYSTPCIRTMETESF